MAKKRKSVTPQNRRKTGVKKLRGDVDPSIGKRTQFQPGQSGNPGGRPKRPLTDAYDEQLSRVKERDPQKRTYAELIADAQIKKALKGNTMAAKEIADRTEGKARQAVDVAFEIPSDFHLTVKFVDSDENGHPKSDSGGIDHEDGC
jgi:hypothetical protein